ncbi:MAG: ATP phosphoribosyltransferase regulatory subunit [Clostridia bacterium]|nr:ATP phosphoribosyltransferase regulatory subunit [Clostridia bacterium]
MDNNSLYTADGFCDTIPSVCGFKREAEETLRRLFSIHGYKEIETPGIEFGDVYTKGDFVNEKNLYKLVDPKGRIICARYDGTIPVARYVATLAKDEALPLRYFYIENMYRYSQVGGGKQSEFTQAGIELLGASGSMADAEVIAIAIKSALAVGIKDLQISIGQNKLFEGVMKQLGIDGSNTEIIANAIATKNLVTLNEIARECGVDSDGVELLTMMAEADGSFETIELFTSKITDETAKEALNNLSEIIDCLKLYDYDKYISIDLGLLENINYYTGLVFKGYTYEVGFPIISGGRYDNVVGKFGRSTSAVGFSLGLSLTITALMRQGKELTEPAAEVIIGYDTTDSEFGKSALALAETLRASGTSVVLDVQGMSNEELELYADKNGINTVIYVNEEYKEEK